ncbi:hypothetical protein [Ramlibacter alkalitolerans]|uniref:HEPN AbiU2-like domain-containing protein n=1 Tax=Ramlibacter alkalitolerans TaxID=2039631 RepID=A0ABS1JUY7_9BURK|nr:hypothetical protein [Ramlibacter alkalitolerans]MBL0427946.1 hypothetical protein [Ramlibacter alkalitolerans]
MSGKELPTQAIDPKLARRLAQAMSDMREAGRYLRALHALVIKEGWQTRGVADATMLAIIVVYARPFIKSRTEGRAAPKLDASALKLFEGRPALQQLHDRLLSLRDKGVAHADWVHHRTHRFGSAGWITMSNTPESARQDLKSVYRLVRHVERQATLLCMPVRIRQASNVGSERSPGAT